MKGESGGIGRVVATVRTRLSRRATLAGALWGVAALGCVLLLAWLAAGPDGWVRGSAMPLFLDLLAIGALATLTAGLAGLKPRWLRDRRLAANIDEAAGLEAGSVLGSLELSRAVPPGVSPELARVAEEQVVRGLRRSIAQLAGGMERETGRWLRAGTGAVAVVVPVVALAGTLRPERSRNAWVGLSSPFHWLAAPAFGPLTVFPGSIDIPRGAAVQIEVGAGGRAEVTLEWQSPGDVLRTVTAATADGVARFDFASVTVPVEYWASTPDGASSPRFTLTPVDPLFVADLSAELTFPPHTGRLPEEYQGEIPPLRLPVGTRVRLEGRASRPLLEAGLVHEDAELRVDLDVTGATFEGTWVPSRSGTYDWSLIDEDGARPDGPADPIDLTLVRDSAPSIAIAYPGRDTLLPLSLRQPLVIEARDDYGIGGLELVAWRVAASGDRGQPVVSPLDVAGTQSVLVRPILDLVSWGLMPGDTVLYFARVKDNAPGEQWTETPRYALRMPGATELRWEAQEQLERAAARVQDLAEEAEGAEERTRNMERQSQERADEAQGARRGRAGNEPLDFQEREDLERALSQQERMADQVDELGAELGQLSESLRDAGVPDPELRGDLEELQDLLDQIATPEMRERMEELRNALAEMDRRTATEALERLADDQEEFRKRLEESLERFRRAAVDQEFRAASSDAQELAREQEMLADAMREGKDLDRRATQQEALRERAEALQERLEGLDERLAQVGEQEARSRADSAEGQTRAAGQQMSQAAREARRANAREAANRAEEAAEALRDASSELQDARQEMAQQAQQAAQQALEQAANDALSLARRQSELRERMPGAGRQELADLQGDEAALLQGVRNMAENLSDASGGSAAVGQELSSAMGRAMQSMQQTLSALENQRGATPSPHAASEGAVDALNQVALQAMASSRRMGEQAAAGTPEQLMEQLETLAQQQGSVMNETSALMPLQLGQEAMANQLQQIAQGQQSVAGELGELAREPGAEEQTLGDLGELAEEARRLAEALASGRLEPETVERQERLFHRLLDAGRSLEKEEFSEERESRTAGAVDARDVPALTAEALGGTRFSLPDAAALQSLPPAQRQMVLDYFERLNRRADSPSQPPAGGEPQ